MKKIHSRKGTRLLAVLTALTAWAVMLSGCGAGGQHAFPLTEPEKVTLHISVEQEPTEEAKTGLRLFAKKLSELTGQGVELSMVYVEDPFASFREGEADILFVSSDTMAAHSPDFAIYTSPFYFRGYEQMTMALNSPLFYENTAQDFREDLGLVQLGAVFRSAKVLLTTGQDLSRVQGFAGITLGVEGERYSSLVFERMGAAVQRLGKDERIDLFAEGKLPAIEFSTQSLGELAVGGIKRPKLIETFHQTKVDWLFISAERYEALSPAYQAAVQEAAAYLVSTVDEAQLKTYRSGLERLQRDGVTVVSTMEDGLQRRAQEILYADQGFYTRTNWDRYDAVSAIVR